MSYYFFPSDIIKIINEYYEYLQGHTYTINRFTSLSHIIVYDKKIVGVDNDTLYVWNSQSGKCKQSIVVGEISSVALCPDEFIVVAAIIYFGIVTLNMHTKIYKYIHMPNFEIVSCIAVFSDNNKMYLVTGSHDGILKIWDLQYQIYINSIVAHLNRITSVLILSNKNIVTTSYDSTIKIWDLKTKKCISVLTGHNEAVMYVVELFDGRIVSASNDRTLKIWNLQNRKCDITIHTNSYTASRIAVLADGRIISSSYCSLLEIWDSDTGNLDISFKENMCNRNFIAVFADGRIITTSSSSFDKFKIWS